MTAKKTFRPLGRWEFMGSSLNPSLNCARICKNLVFRFFLVPAWTATIPADSLHLRRWIDFLPDAESRWFGSVFLRELPSRREPAVHFFDGVVVNPADTQ